MNRTIQGLQRMLSSLRGYDAVFHFERRRLSLRCLNCGHEITGWMFGPEPRQPKPPAVDIAHAHVSGFSRVRRVFEACASLCHPAIQ